MKHWISRLRKTAEKQEGLTLIELLAVVTILGIIAAVAVPITLTAIDRSKEKTTMSEVAELQTALDRYAQDHNGAYPATGTDLLTNPQKLSNYISQFDGKDAWDSIIEYSTSTDTSTNTASYTIWAPKTGTQTGVQATNSTPPQKNEAGPTSGGTLAPIATSGS